MISDHELVMAAAATYARDATPICTAYGTSVNVFLSRADGLNVISIEGTHDPLGWLIDLLATKTEDHETANHPTLGFLHAGFYASALQIIPRVSLIAAQGPYAICGHSLGAAMALLLAGLLIDDGDKPVRIGAFAPPRVGGDQFVKIVTSVPLGGFRFGNDPVTDVPWTIEPDYPYRQVPLSEVGAPMIDGAACHHINNYIAGVPAL